MNWDALNEFERCEAVARAIGWTYKPRFAGDASGYWVRPDGHRYIAEDLPDFVNSLDDVRMAEDEIEQRGLGNAYTRRLLAIVTGEEWDITKFGEGEVDADQLFTFLRATPDQRCRAALEVLS